MLKCMTPQARPSVVLRPRLWPGRVAARIGGCHGHGGRRVLGLPRVTTRVKVASDVENVRDLASRVDRSHGVVGSFRGVSTLNVLEDGLAPPTSARPAQRPWKQRVGWCSDRVPGHGAPGRRCLHRGAVWASCAGLRAVRLRHRGRRERAGRDRGQHQCSAEQPGSLDVPGLGLACGADGAVVDVVYYSGLVAGSSVAVVPTLPCPPRPPSLALQRRHRLAPYPPLPACPMQCRAFLGACHKPWGCSFPALPPLPVAPSVPVPQPLPTPVPTPAPPALVPCRQSESSVARASCPAGGARRRCARARSALPATWIQTQTPRGSIPGVGSSRRWRP